MFASWLVMSCGLPAKPKITVPESAVAFPGDLTHIPRLGFMLKSTRSIGKSGLREVVEASETRQKSLPQLKLMHAITLSAVTRIVALDKSMMLQ